jgi:protein-S-isoprenylcysteine O-methyltransferase Ste14
MCGPRIRDGYDLMMQSTSAPGRLAIEPTATSKVLGGLTYFFIRRRIFISFVVFAALIAGDMVRGIRPHNLVDFRNPASVVGILLVIVGLAVRSWAAGILRKDEQLTTTGPYRLVRNPLYLGSFLMMFGFCTLLNDPLNLLFVAGPMLLLYAVKVRNEEQWLARLFPATFAQYTRATPRFVPRIGRTDLLVNWSRSQWIRAREYQAVGAALVALVALQVWHVLG